MLVASWPCAILVPMTSIEPNRGREPFAASCLLVGVVASIVVMVFHPTGHDLVNGTDRAGAIHRDQWVHAVAIGAMLLQTTGMLALTRRLRRSVVGAADLAMVLWCAGVVAVLIAAVASGFVAPGLLPPEGPPDASWRWNHLQNQSFAAVFVVASSAAIVAWSIAGWQRGLSRWLRTFGVTVPVVLTAFVVAGRLRLGVHGFFVVVLVEAVWAVGAAIELRRSAA